MIRAGVALLALGLLFSGCSGGSGGPPASPEVQVSNQLQGVWRVTSYVPDSALSPAMLLSMQADKILVRFEQGRVRSATSALTFDRAFRVTNAQGRNFSLIVSDEEGIEVESRAQWDDAGRILFQTITAPWVGRGVLEREGPAVPSPPPGS